MDEEDDVISSADSKSLAALADPQPTTLSYNNFDGKKTILLVAAYLSYLYLFSLYLKFWIPLQNT